VCKSIIEEGRPPPRSIYTREETVGKKKPWDPFIGTPSPKSGAPRRVSSKRSEEKEQREKTRGSVSEGRDIPVGKKRRKKESC